ncbi:MAG: hypothetical protein IPJ17_09885 [Holophagales bacterium]|nr:MAG: hypothetical protein IPJ17_09885 [Holophagales bacterium]
MKTKLVASLAALLLLAGVTAALAADPVTLTGKIACAHCTLKLEGVTACQDVLVVEKDGAKPAYYYLAKSEALKSFGHTCMGEKKATVTGTLSEKDGKTWLEATKIAPVS